MYNVGDKWIWRDDVCAKMYLFFNLNKDNK